MASPYGSLAALQYKLYESIPGSALTKNTASATGAGAGASAGAGAGAGADAEVVCVVLTL